MAAILRKGLLDSFIAKVCNLDRSTSFILKYPKNLQP